MDKVIIKNIEADAYVIPTDFLESDGTLAWDKTTLVVVRIKGGGHTGLGFTYSDVAACDVIRNKFIPLLVGQNAFDIPTLWLSMVKSIRNIGLQGVVSAAISAVDTALWDLKAKCLELPLYSLWGRIRESVPVYGSGGFTSYSNQQLSSQFESWKEQGIKKFKMKVGREPKEDVLRVKDAREVIGNGCSLFVDANGAYDRRQALDFAKQFAQYGVEWFEEPVSSDDLEGLCLIREHAPVGMNITAGEYGYDIDYFRRMLEAQAVDILQADATRCCGFTGFWDAAVLSRAFHVPFSSHTSPALHLHACLCMSHVCHMEYFHDHVRIENMLFEGLPILKDGCLFPDPSHPGLGLQFKEEKAEAFLVKGEAYV